MVYILVSVMVEYHYFSQNESARDFNEDELNRVAKKSKRVLAMGQRLSHSKKLDEIYITF
jgi:hypothetical protein